MAFYYYYFKERKKNRLLAASLFICLAVIFSACHKPLIVEVPCGPRTTRVVPPANLPNFKDDLDLASLKAGLAGSLRYWRKQDPSRKVDFCGNSYSRDQVVESLEKFAEITNGPDVAEMNSRLVENFDVCQVQNGGNALVTGYFQPTFRGSPVFDPPFVYPLYGNPKDLVRRKVIANGQEKFESGRLVDGKFMPYWSRAEIENQNLLAGQEIAYLDDPVKVFFLHIQGSGLIVFPDGSLRSILFAGTNDLPYSSIGKLLAQEGKIPLEEMSMPRIQQYLNEHLDEQQRILHYNKRFVFFRWGEDGGNNKVFGSMGEELTRGRSAALDQQCFPAGIPAFLKSSKPLMEDDKVVEWQPLERFVFNHDSGAAIKGAARLDLFFGRGNYAQAAAGVMKQPGKLYFFMKKQ